MFLHNVVYVAKNRLKTNWRRIFILEFYSESKSRFV